MLDDNDRLWHWPTKAICEARVLHDHSTVTHAEAGVFTRLGPRQAPQPRTRLTYQLGYSPSQSKKRPRTTVWAGQFVRAISVELRGFEPLTPCGLCSAEPFGPSFSVRIPLRIAIPNDHDRLRTGASSPS